MKRAIYLAILGAGLPVSAYGEGNFECIVDFVTGFHYDETSGNWNATAYLPGERFSIKEVRPDVYTAARIDEHRAWSAMCERRPDQTEDSFSCRNGTNEIHFNRVTLRFTSFRYFGYWNGSKDSLSLAIGSCART